VAQTVGPADKPEAQRVYAQPGNRADRAVAWVYYPARHYYPENLLRDWEGSQRRGHQVKMPRVRERLRGESSRGAPACRAVRDWFGGESRR
jgi:hypothetical protein